MLKNIGAITVQVSDQDKGSLVRATLGDLFPANSVNKGLWRITTLGMVQMKLTVPHQQTGPALSC